MTTVTSCGSVNGAMESLTGIGGVVPLADMQVGEVIFGGVGSGLYGMLLFVILAVFISGLMVGRTPEFLGKKIEAREVKLTVIGDDRRADGRARRDRAGDDQVGQGVDLQLRAPGLLRDALRLHVAGATTTARRSPATRASCSRRTPMQFGITFADILGGLTMLAARFLPLLAVLARRRRAGRQDA